MVVSENPVFEGESILFICSTVALPTVIYYQIFHDGNLVQNNTNRSFFINVSKSYHEGQYECKAVNVVGMNSIGSVRVNISGKYKC